MELLNILGYLPIGTGSSTLLHLSSHFLELFTHTHYIKVLRYLKKTDHPRVFSNLKFCQIWASSRVEKPTRHKQPGKIDILIFPFLIYWFRPCSCRLKFLHFSCDNFKLSCHLAMLHIRHKLWWIKSSSFLVYVPQFLTNEED